MGTVAQAMNVITAQLASLWQRGWEGRCEQEPVGFAEVDTKATIQDSCSLEGATCHVSDLVSN